MLLLGALALAIPAVTLASGGGSAGDQQYTDPFAGTAPGKSKPKTTTTGTPTTSSQPAATTPAATPTTKRHARGEHLDVERSHDAHGDDRLDDHVDDRRRAAAHRL